jgi:hypothetical protein
MSIKNSTEIEDITRFWRHLFGGQTGLLQVWTVVRDETGDTLDETIKSEFFNCPDAAKAAASWALERSKEEGREVYFCAHLLNGKRRIKKYAAAVKTLWGDLDGAAVPNESLTPTAVVESSPGRFHCYWRLTDAIPPETAENLNRRIARKIEADPSGFDLSQLLRVPGTINHKHEDCPTVTVRDLNGNLEYTPAELEQILPVIDEPPAADSLQSDEDEPPVALGGEDLKVWRGEKPVLKDDGSQEVDRSRSLMKIGRVIYDAGLNRSAVVAALRERDAALGWGCYTDRKDGDKQYNQIFNKLEKEGRNPRMEFTVSGRRPHERRGLPPNHGNAGNAGNAGNGGNGGNATPISANDLLAMAMPEVQWAVPDILPAGVSLLVGKPKLGKSWLAVSLAEAIAAGGVALGVKRVTRGETLYLALEDNYRRLQKRLRKILEGRSAPDGMFIHTEWQRVDEGGAEALDQWLTEHPDARFVCIDT